MKWDCYKKIWKNKKWISIENSRQEFFVLQNKISKYEKENSSLKEEIFKCLEKNKTINDNLCKTDHTLQSVQMIIPTPDKFYKGKWGLGYTIPKYLKLI